MKLNSNSKLLSKRNKSSLYASHLSNNHVPINWFITNETNNRIIVLANLMEGINNENKCDGINRYSRSGDKKPATNYWSMNDEHMKINPLWKHFTSANKANVAISFVSVHFFCYCRRRCVLFFSIFARFIRNTFRIL